MMNLEDLFARQRQTWATCPDWVQTMILQNIRETIKAKMEKEHGIQEDRREGFTDDWEAVAAEVQNQMSSWAPPMSNSSDSNTPNSTHSDTSYSTHSDTSNLTDSESISKQPVYWYPRQPK